MNTPGRIGFVVMAVLLFNVMTPAQQYAGSEQCKACHNEQSSGGLQWQYWSRTLHSMIHLVPDDVSVRPLEGFNNGDSVSITLTSGTARVYLRRDSAGFYARITAGGPEYRIAWTNGWGMKQRYLVKIDTSYYVLPIQYNLPAYLNNAPYSSSNWARYSEGTWFNSDGTLKLVDNSFRTKSWDKNCAGCHVTGGNVQTVISGSDTAWRMTWVNGSAPGDMVVGCESCHGPSAGGSGEGHQMNPARLNTRGQKMEVCGQCHNRASSWRGDGLVGTHEYPLDEIGNRYFNPADTNHPLAEFMNFATLPNVTGGPGMWPDLQTARLNRQQYQEMLGSKHYSTPFADITCFTCHSAHSNTPNAHNIVDSLSDGTDRFKVANEDNTLCLVCHATHGPFAGIPKIWIADPVTFKDSIGSVVNLHTRHSVYDPKDELNSGGAGRCSKCHMTRTATTARAYDIHTHTFAVVSPRKTLDYASTTVAGFRGMLNSCASACHRNPVVGSIIPDFGTGTDPVKTDWGEAADIALAETLWNYWQAWGFTGIREVPNVIPVMYELSQNYPNPFNPSTTIAVDVPRNGNVRVVVYNLIGEIVATLMDGTFAPGRYEVTWSGRDDAGLQVASGMYMYRMEAGTMNIAKKMMLLK
jgi:hypothetical protein